MSTTLIAGQESIWIESQSPCPGWIRARLQNNPKISSEAIDVLNKTIRRSVYI